THIKSIEISSKLAEEIHRLVKSSLQKERLVNDKNGIKSKNMGTSLSDGEKENKVSKAVEENKGHGEKENCVINSRAIKRKELVPLSEILNMEESAKLRKEEKVKALKMF
ncbi:hypothetical protein AVEN_155857-1, partial [Araneus ventricosus]